MLTKKIFKNVGTTITLCLALSIIAGTSQAAIVSSYDSSATVTISTDFDGLDLESMAFDFDLITTGLGSGTESGSADDFFTLNTGDDAELFASASGQVNDGPGSVGSFRLSDGILTIDNSNGQSALTGEITFSYELLASLFTDSGDESGISYASIYVYDDANDFIDEFLEIENIPLTATDEQFNVFDSLAVLVNVAAGEIYEIFVELDASGFADSVRQPVTNVSAPAGMAMLLIGFALLYWRRERKS